MRRTQQTQGVALGCFVAALQAEQMRMRPSRPTSCEMVAASTKRSENPKGRNPEKRRRGNRVSPNKTPTPVRLSGFRPFGISSSVWQRRSIGAQRRPVIDQPTRPSLCALGVLCGWFPGGTTDGLPKPLRLNSGETSYVATVVDEESKDGERVAPTGHHITVVLCPFGAFTPTTNPHGTDSGSAGRLRGRWGRASAGGPTRASCRRGRQRCPGGSSR